MPSAHRSGVSVLEFHPSNDVLLASAGNDGVVRIWDSRAGVELSKYAAHRSAVTSVRFVGKGRALAAGAEDGRIAVSRTRAHPAATSAVFSCQSRALPRPKATRLARVDQHSRLQVFDLAAGRLAGESTPASASASSAASGAAGTGATGGGGGGAGGLPSARGDAFTHRGGVTFLEAHPSPVAPFPTIFASGGVDHVVRFWAVDLTGEES